MKHIILIGFKHVGKSRIGQSLSQELGLPYIDLDWALQERYSQKQGVARSCREIMKEHGHIYFRALEHETLQDVLQRPEQTVISLGGGAALQLDHHALLRKHTVVHVTSPKSFVYERIMVNGRPAFFGAEKNAHDAFERVWRERIPVYEELAHLTIQNNGTIQEAANKLKLCLSAVI